MQGHEEPGRTAEDIEYLRSQQDLTFKPQISERVTPNRVSMTERIEASPEWKQKKEMGMDTQADPIASS